MQSALVSVLVALDLVRPSSVISLTVTRATDLDTA